MKPFAIILLLTVTACQGAKTKQDGAPDKTLLCRILPGKAETLGPSRSGIQYLSPSLGSKMVACQTRGYPKCLPIVSAFESEWYSKHWEAAGEPSLYEASRIQRSDAATLLRFTWLPTFHHPVMVRFETNAGSVTMIAKELSGAGGYDPGTIKRQISRTLTGPEARQLADTMTEASPFKDPPSCTSGFDGSEWILERANNGTYALASEFSPSRGSMRDIGILALKLTGWQFEEIY